MNPDEELQRAALHFRSGRLLDATRLVQELLERRPNWPDALRLLAAIAESEGRLHDADRILAALVDIAPTDADAFDDVIRVSHARGDLRRLAEGLLGRLRLTPDKWELWSDLGAALERLGQTREADTAYRRATVIAPSADRPILNRASLSHRADAWSQAFCLARRAQAIKSHSEEALLIIGYACQSLGKDHLAAYSYRLSLVLGPSNPDGWRGVSAISSTLSVEQQLNLRLRAFHLAPNNLDAIASLAEGNRIAGKPEAACWWARRAICLAPSSVATHNTLSVAHTELGLDLDALLWAQRAAALAPAKGHVLVNLGVVLKTLGRFKEAERAIRDGIARGVDPSAHLSLATTLLVTNQIPEGLKEFEWRNAGANSPYKLIPVKRWDGSPLPKERLLIWGDQGLGDEIMFSQFIPQAQKLAPSLLVECDPRLVSIFQRSYPEIDVIARVPEGHPRVLEHDVGAQIALCSLPYALGLDEATIQSNGPFLVPDPARALLMAARLQGLGTDLKVGIAWRSLKDTAHNRRLHTRLAEWRTILQTPNIRFINLQYGDHTEEIEDAERTFGVEIVQFDDIDLFNDMEDILALSSQLDLVVATTTTAYTLAAAAGVETWLLMARFDYRSFGMERDPLSPVSRAFIREQDESWNPAIEAMAQALALHPKRRADPRRSG